MLPSFNYNTLVSSIPLYNTFVFTKAFVKESCSQALDMIPFGIIALAGHQSLQVAANLTYGSLSFTKGIQGYKNVYKNKNEDSGLDRLTKTIASTRDIGIGCLLMVAELTQSPEAKNGVKIYYLLSGGLQTINAARECAKDLPPEQKGQAVAKLATGYFKFISMLGAVVDTYIYNDPNFVFSRKNYLDLDVQVSAISQKAFGIIHSKSPKEILFDEASLTPFDRAGTCSAMALDFVSRYNTKCKDVLDQLSCVKEMKYYYEANTEVYSSIQAAFNTINVIGSESREGLPQSGDMIAYQKIQSLANYHSLTLNPVTKTFNTEYEDIAIRNELDTLGWGTYVIRMIHPYANHKQEAFGHTMGLIKNKDQSFFYDNSNGLRKLSNFPEDVMSSLSKWSYIPTLRIYKAECPSTGCENLNQAQVDKLQA